MYQALGPAIGKLSETTESRHGCKVNWETCLIKKIWPSRKPLLAMRWCG